MILGSPSNLASESDLFAFLDELVDAAKNRKEDAAIGQFDKYLDKTFGDKVLEIIQRKHLNHIDVYKAAGMDRRLFSKTVNNKNYKLSKNSVISLILALEVDFDEADDLMHRAGFSFSHCTKQDVIVEYFIKKKIYSIQFLNEVFTFLELPVLC